VDIKVEVREQTIIGSEKPTLDEIVLFVDGKCLFHLEQMSDNHCTWDYEGDIAPRTLQDGKDLI